MIQQQTLIDLLKRMLQYILIYSALLFIYLNFFHQKHDDVESYAKTVISEQYLTPQSSCIISSQSCIHSNEISIILDNNTASITHMQSNLYQTSLEDSNIFFGSNTLHPQIHERIWVEVMLDNVKVSLMKPNIISQSNNHIEYKASLQDHSDIYIIITYNLKDSIIHITTQVINNTNSTHQIQTLICTQIDEKKSAEYMHSAGFLSDSVQGFITKSLNHKTLKSHIYKANSSGWFGSIRKYWLIATHPDLNIHTSRFLSAFQYQSHVYLISMSTPATLQSNTSNIDQISIYAGPKHTNHIHQAEQSLNTNNTLIKTMDYGWLSWLNALLRIIIDFLIEICGRADYALLAFVVMMRLLLLIPYIISEKHARLIFLLDDRIKRIKEQYMSEEMAQAKISELYAEYGVNKYISSFPMIVQLSWFIPLNIMSQFFVFRGATFFNLSPDLSALDPTSWTNLFGLLPWQVIHIRWINFGFWVMLFALTYLISEDLSRMDKIFIVFMIVSTIIFYKNLPVIFTIFWCIVNIIGAIQTILFKLILHPRIKLKSKKTTTVL